MASPSPPLPPASKNPTDPPWTAIILVARLLDPKALALACCVSKSWNAAMSSDDLWLRHCSAHHPSALLTLPSLPPRRLFALLRSSGHRRRRRRPPAKPLISLPALLFAVDIFHNGSPVISLAKPGGDLERHCSTGVFRFDVDVEYCSVAGEEEELRAVWTVATKGWRAAFSMMDGSEKGRLVGGNEVWFSEELPVPGCCTALAVMSGGCSGGGGLVAELGLGLGGGGGRRVIRRVSLGLMSVAEWRYLGLDDALLYLQSFLMTGTTCNI